MLGPDVESMDLTVLLSCLLHNPNFYIILGNDGCLFCFGHANLGKSWTMIGDDASVRNIGVIPTAVAWLYKSIKDRRAKTGARFSVRVSAVEISGKY